MHGWRMPAHGRHFLLIYDWHGGHPCWHDKLRTTAADLAHSCSLSCAQAINALAYSPDGSGIVAGVRNGDVEIWDIPGAALVSEESHGGPVTAVAWSADGDYVASGSTDNTIKVWRPVMGGGTTSRKFHVLSRAGPGPKDKFLPQGRPGSEIRVFETQGGAQCRASLRVWQA